MIFNNVLQGTHRRARLVACCLLGLCLVACGGGGSSTAATAVTSSTTAAATPVPVTVPVTVPAPVTAALTNVQAVIVDSGPASEVNMPFTSITVCTPGNSNACQTIDHILIDTGSVGLRLFSSVVSASLKLPQQTAASGSALAECTQFADGYSWGPVRSADVQLGGETVHGMLLQIIGDPAFAAIPAGCSATGPAENTVAAFGSNGVLGIGTFLTDCGTACAQRTTAGAYYACPASGCIPTTVPVAQQIPQPVSLLATNNNGVILQLPTVAQGGAVSVAGSLIFGIGTASNNGLGTARVYTVSPTDATLSITANGTVYKTSFIDSGSNGIFLPLPNVPACKSGFYCPAVPVSVAMVLQGTNGNNTSVNIVVSNADALFRDYPTFAVLPTLAGAAYNNTSIDLGLPFFLGRTVFTAIEGRVTPGGTGPYIAF